MSSESKLQEIACEIELKILMSKMQEVPPMYLQIFIETSRAQESDLLGNQMQILEHAFRKRHLAGTRCTMDN